LSLAVGLPLAHEKVNQILEYSYVANWNMDQLGSPLLASAYISSAYGGPPFDIIS
jgi:hypothetical protein